MVLPAFGLTWVTETSRGAVMIRAWLEFVAGELLVRTVRVGVADMIFRFTVGAMIGIVLFVVINCGADCKDEVDGVVELIVRMVTFPRLPMVVGLPSFWTLYCSWADETFGFVVIVTTCVRPMFIVLTVLAVSVRFGRVTVCGAELTGTVILFSVSELFREDQVVVASFGAPSFGFEVTA